MKNAAMNKTKRMSMDETALVFVKKINMGGSNLLYCDLEQSAVSGVLNLYKTGLDKPLSDNF